MIDPITGFINVLSDNDYKIKVSEISDDVDQKDELLSEIYYTGEIPSSMVYFELNGFSGPIDFEDFLEKNFKSFKIYLLSQSTKINLDLVAEIREQILTSKAALNHIKQGFSNNMNFLSVVDLKIRYGDETLDFLDKSFNTMKSQTPDKVSSGTEDPPVYVFRINKDINERISKNIIKTLHKELKLNGYIDCTLPQFRQLFSLDKIPHQTPDPVVWKGKTYYHFSYFIKCINRPFLAHSREPSNNEIALKLFLSPDGGPLTETRARFDSNSGKTQEVKAIFDKIMKKCGLEKPTTKKKKPTF